MQKVVDLPYEQLSGSEKITHDVVMEAIGYGRYPAIVLFGDVLTPFGAKAELLARSSGMKVFLLGFGDGTFGRRYRAWFRSRQKTGTALAVDHAEKIGLHIC